MDLKIRKQKQPHTETPAKSRGSDFIRRLKQQKLLQLMALSGMVWLLIFHYIPMYGIIISFKEFNIVRSIAQAPWVGLEHFRAFFEDDSLPYVIKNTLGMSCSS